MSAQEYTLAVCPDAELRTDRVIDGYLYGVWSATHRKVLGAGDTPATAWEDARQYCIDITRV